MGTNYYAAGDDGEALHVGKSSAGWSFSFHGITECGLVTWAAWREYLQTHALRDEYGKTVSLADLEVLVESKRSGLNHTRIFRTPRAQLTPEERAQLSPHSNPRFDVLYAQTLWQDADGHSFSSGEFS
jgi:hypothetical protein